MSSLNDRIEQFRKMVAENPDDELGHFRLGQLLMEDQQHTEAAESFRKALALSPEFSKIYQLLGECLIRSDLKERATEVLTEGWKVADQRGDRMPRDAMAKLLKEIGAPVPEKQIAVVEEGPDTGFRCARPGCPSGRTARKLETPPIDDPIGFVIVEKICSTCWDLWKKEQSVKVINELRLDLSSESGADEYDRYLREYFGLEEAQG